MSEAIDASVRTWWPVAALLVVLPLGALLRWAAGAYVRIVSRAEAVAVVGEAMKAQEAAIEEVRSGIDSIQQGQVAISNQTATLDARLLRVEKSLNGALVRVAWDRKTERRRRAPEEEGE